MRTFILGLDAFDPNLFERMHESGRLPNLGKYVDAKCYSRFQVSNPPQSEVSWTSIATGLDPGGHGMFDFVHRDPGSYALHVSLLPTGKKLGGIQFVRPHSARTMFDVAAEQGFPSTSVWWPATFPARPESPVRSLPGLGAPDIQGRLGVGAFYTTQTGLPEKIGKTPAFQLKREGGDRYSGQLNGPMSKKGYLTLPVELLVKNEEAADLKLGEQILKLKLGEWSTIVELKFKAGFLVSVHALTRVILTQLKPDIRLYILPLQLHPLKAIWPYGTPPSFVKDAWKTAGPFLTLGWPQDTTGLEDGCISDEQFLALCDSIYEARANLLMHHLESFSEGLLAAVFDSLDRIQHMFWRDRPDVIESWYQRLDELVGRAAERVMAKSPMKTRLLIVSDHGFTRFDHKVHLNRWLIEQGYLVPVEEAPTGDLKKVNWSRSRAYAIGLNSIYLNLAGREGQGQVPADQQQALTEEIRQGLLAWRGPDDQAVVRQSWQNRDAFSGPLTSYGPDLVVGYAPGYRASAETGLGAWEAAAVEPNSDHWGADHCIDPDSVPGVLFYSGGLSDDSQPSYRDIPALAIDAAPDSKGAAPPKTGGAPMSAEEQEEMEERLKSLGYL